MKVFNANLGYRGRFFDVTFCAKTMKEACKIIDVNMYYMKTYIGSGMEIKTPFTEIYATAYSHKAVVDIGHRNKILYEDAKIIVDRKCDEVSESWKNP